MLRLTHITSMVCLDQVFSHLIKWIEQVTKWLFFNKKFFKNLESQIAFF